jgi:glycine/D-amino acid oxidase-like deaminating enzyme
LQSNPIWPVKTRFPKLNDDINVDVGIIGGGIAGISSAYHLKNAGYRVAILEQDEIGSAATGASSGILYYGSGTNFVEAMALFGKEKAKFLWSETEKMINDITKLVEDNDIDCGLRKCGAIMVAKNDHAGLIRKFFLVRKLGRSFAQDHSFRDWNSRSAPNSIPQDSHQV